MSEMKRYYWKDVEHLKIHGRTDLNNDLLPLFANGSAIEMNVSGSELWIEVDVNCDFHEPWIYTELNGAFMSRQMLLPGTYEICLFRSMEPSKVKNFRFIRELQAMHEDDYCHIYVRSIRTDGEFFPVPEYDYKFEFIGDSISSGEGTYGAKADEDWLAMYMSSSKTYARIIANEMNAEIRNISQGGFGVFCGWDNDPRSCIPPYYEQVCGLGFGEGNKAMGAHAPYDFSSWVPDAIIVNLGTNDNSAFRTPPFELDGVSYKQRNEGTEENIIHNKEDLQKVLDATYDFISMIRKNNPSSHIVWCYGMLGFDLGEYFMSTIDKYIKDTGDTNVAFLELPNTTEETAGAHFGHPGYASHQKAAKVLIEYLKGVVKK